MTTELLVCHTELSGCRKCGQLGIFSFIHTCLSDNINQQRSLASMKGYKCQTFNTKEE